MGGRGEGGREKGGVEGGVGGGRREEWREGGREKGGKEGGLTIYSLDLSLPPLGYEATVFGVHYQCSVKIPDNPIIRVIPKLPLLQVRSFPVLTSAATEDMGELKQRRSSKVGLEKFHLLDGER